MNEFDLIVIGAGPGGYETAARAARAGLRVMIAERSHPGGTCLNRGCIPTKALCRSAEIALDLRRAAEFGVNAGDGAAVDFAAVMARKDDVVNQLREGVMTELAGVEYVHGEARLAGPDTVEVDGNIYKAAKIIIATGSAPAALNIPGADLAADSDAMLQWTTLPESLAIIGGGVIGMEFASIMAAFGVKVSVIEYCPEILPPFDAEVAKRLRMALKRRGINIVTGAAVTSIEEGMTVNYTAKGRESKIQAERVLMAVGRRPVLPAGIAEAGIETDRRGFIKVDSQMQTTVKGVYAIGDVNGLCMLAHAASAQGLVALGLDMKLEPVPSVVFTHPECAAVGLTEKQCEEKELDFTVGRATFRANGKALTMGETDGLVKAIVERTTGRILGCHICGPHAADLISEAALAISCGVTASGITTTIHAHPTLSEALKAAFAAIE